jgi:hypothetical protein
MTPSFLLVWVCPEFPVLAPELMPCAVAQSAQATEVFEEPFNQANPTGVTSEVMVIVQPCESGVATVAS